MHSFLFPLSPPPRAVQVGSEKKTAILDEHDPIWKELRDLFLADMRPSRLLLRPPASLARHCTWLWL